MATFVSVSSVNLHHHTLSFPIRSEGPAQVFLLLLVWMTSALSHLSRVERKKIVLSYDNMCHVDNLRVAKKPLPLPGENSIIVPVKTV